MRWAVYVWNADGDMGDGAVIGAFKSAFAAGEVAAKIWREADRTGSRVDATVVPLHAGSTSVRKLHAQIDTAGRV